METTYKLIEPYMNRNNNQTPQKTKQAVFYVIVKQL